MKRTLSVLFLCLLLFSGLAYAAPAAVQPEPAQTVEELRDKWDALTKRQKSAVYKLFAQRGRAEIALMNEYARLGMVTQEEAAAFAERVASWLDALEQSGDLPPVYGYARSRQPAPQHEPPASQHEPPASPKEPLASHKEPSASAKPDAAE
ncbi:MAG: hypothetical protein SO063_00600 [Eubacteriales bacterium]|nr:hypothetical protein [Eubacteriales bacterium]